MTANIEETAALSRLERLQAALDSGTQTQVKRLLHNLHPAEIASLLESLPPPERTLLWGVVDNTDHGDTLVHVNDEVRAGLIDNMSQEALLDATESLDFDDLADIIHDLPHAVTRQLLTSMDQQDRLRLAAVLAYPEDSAGGLMNTDAITIRPDVTVDVVLRYLRQKGKLPAATDGLMVVSRYGEYVGMLPITTLLVCAPDQLIHDIMETSIKPIDGNTPASEVAKLFEDRNYISAPVIDSQLRLIGRITIDDVVDVIREEAEHSMLSMAGLDEEDDMFAPVIPSARRRAIWLGINLLTAFMAAAVVGLFQLTLDKVVALAVLMPIVASMGGIAGSQTLMLMIRGLALGQVGKSNARWLMTKELAVATLNGLGWSILVGVVAGLWFQSLPIALIIGAALIINLLAAALSGVFIPLILKKLNLDPALAGSVVLTTVTDIVGYTAFLGLGAIFLL